MTTFIRRLKKLKANSFTLVELLVVISIIGLLAGLAVPAIQGALDKAKQQGDVSNIRQCGLIAFSFAQDYDGGYNGNLTNLTSSKDYFTNLVALKLLTSAKILAGNGFTAATTLDTIDTPNIAWAYVKDLTTSDDGQLPLFLSKGYSAITATQTLSTTVGWKTKGLVVYRVGNSAEFLKNGNQGATVGSVNMGLNTNSVPNTIVQ